MAMVTAAARSRPAPARPYNVGPFGTGHFATYYLSTGNLAAPVPTGGGDWSPYEPCETGTWDVFVPLEQVA